MRTFVREKKIYCGRDYLEVDIFNYTKSEDENARRGKRSKKEVDSSLKQVKWNEINSKRRFVQLVNTNFHDGDFHTSLTYADGFLPASTEDAERDLRNFLRRVEYRRKKLGLPPMKYIAIPACLYKKDGTTYARPHHHIIMSGGLDRDELEALWRKPRRAGQKEDIKIGTADAKRLQTLPGENGFARLCDYLANQPSGKKRFSPSQGLEKPKIDPDTPPTPPHAEETHFSASANLTRPWSRTSDHAFSRKEVERIAKTPPDAAYWEKRYKGYTIAGGDYGFKAVYSDSRGWGLYIKLRRIRE